MRFSREEKLKIYQLYRINRENFQYLMRVLDCHGIEWLNRSYHYWTKEEKQTAIDRVLIHNESRRQVSIDLGLPSTGTLTNWIHDFQKTVIMWLINQKEGH